MSATRNGYRAKQRKRKNTLQTYPDFNVEYILPLVPVNDSPDETLGTARQSIPIANPITAAGFTDVGCDKFRCGSCNLGLKDVPWHASLLLEHFTFSPRCSYLRSLYHDNRQLYRDLQALGFNHRNFKPHKGHFVNVRYIKDKQAIHESFVNLFGQLSQYRITLFCNSGFYAKGYGTVACILCDLSIDLEPMAPIVDFNKNKNIHHQQCSFKTLKR